MRISRSLVHLVSQLNIFEIITIVVLIARVQYSEDFTQTK